MKIYGDMGSPSRMPLDGLKNFVDFPLIKIEMVEADMQFMISLIREVGNPRL